MSCECCNRKDFIYGLLSTAAMAGCAMRPKELEEFYATLPEATPAGAIPDKSGALKVRLVFSIWDEVQVRKTWPNVGFDFKPVMKNITDALNAGVKGVKFIPGQAYDEKTARKILSDDAVAGDVVGYMVIQMNSWPNALQPICSAGKPTLFCSFPYSGIGGWDVYNAAMLRKKQPNYAFISSMDFNDTIGVARAFEELRYGTGADFVKAATKYRLDHTPAPSGIKPVEGPLSCLTPEEALAVVRGKKILSVPGYDKESKEAILRDFGIIVEDVSFSEVNRSWKSVSDEEARRLVREWECTARRIGDDVTDKSLMDAAKLYRGMDELLKSHGAEAISISCIPGCYNGTLTAYPCLGFMELQDRGLFGTCENDIRSTVMMMVVGAMTKGRMGYISDPAIDSSRRAISYAHCVSTRKFFGPKGPTAEYDILTHAEDRGGASIYALAPINYPVTTVQVMFPANGQPGRIAVQTGRTIANDPDERACRTKIVAEIDGDFERVYGEWDLWSWHRVTFVGDFKKDVEALAAKLGYQLVREC